MCPTVPGWRALWLSRMREVMGQLHPAMFQVDQVCGCWGMPCYDQRHPHDCPALAWRGYKEFTRAMRARAKEANPEAALWSEGVNDILGQAFDGLQAQLGFESLLAGLGEWEPRLFKYTFPEYILVTGDLDGLDSFALSWAIITGGHFHFFIPEPEQLDTGARRRVRFAARARSRYWREFTSAEVFVPEVSGDSGVKTLGYRSGRRWLLVGAPLEPRAEPDRPFRVSVKLPGTSGRLLRCDWMNGADAGAVTLRKNRCYIRGRGLFLAVLS
jgi:hypothetical protein